LNSKIKGVAHQAHTLTACVKQNIMYLRSGFTKPVGWVTDKDMAKTQPLKDAPQVTALFYL